MPNPYQYPEIWLIPSDVQRTNVIPKNVNTCCLFLQAADMPGRETYAVHPNKDGSITLQYHPTDTGIHELNLSHNDKQCDGKYQYMYYTSGTDIHERDLSKR